MIFKDLSVWDLNLIKNYASNLIVSSKISNRYEALVESLLICVYSKGFKIEEYPQTFVKDTVYQLRNDSDLGADEVLEKVFSIIENSNLKIVKNPSKDVTWNQPRDSWYIKNFEPKKPWMF